MTFVIQIVTKYTSLLVSGTIRSISKHLSISVLTIKNRVWNLPIFKNDINAENRWEKDVFTLFRDSVFIE